MRTTQSDARVLGANAVSAVILLLVTSTVFAQTAPTVSNDNVSVEPIMVANEGLDPLAEVGLAGASSNGGAVRPPDPLRDKLILMGTTRAKGGNSVGTRDDSSAIVHMRVNAPEPIDDLRSKFVNDAREAGLVVIGDVDISPIGKGVRTAGLTALTTDTDVRGLYYLNRSVVLIDHQVFGTVAFATTEIRLERVNDTISVQFTLGFDSVLDQIARAPTGIAGVVMRHQATITFDDLDAIIHAASDPNQAFSITNISSTDPSNLITSIVEEITLRRVNGEQVSLMPGTTTLGAALAQLGDTTAFGTSCAGCFPDCLEYYGILVPGANAYACLALAIIPCVPLCIAVPPSCPFCLAGGVLACGAAYTVSQIAILGICFIECLDSPEIPNDVPDCNGNCAPISWIGDGSCDDGSFYYNGVYVNFNCDAFNCDNRDCNCCPSGKIKDCNGVCGPESWIGDGICDDGSGAWNFNCDALNNDGGDCAAGACCLATDDCVAVTDFDCATYFFGAYRGDNTTCAAASCATRCPSTCDWCWTGTPIQNNCPAEWNGTSDGCDCGCQFNDPDCESPPCTESDCTPWVPGLCDEGTCTSVQRRFTRSCPQGCSLPTQKCEIDYSCEHPPCQVLPEYEFCRAYGSGNCTVSMHLNLYTKVNNIRWGQVVDGSDPYVIGQYRIGWTGDDAEQMYYGCDCNSDCSNECEYGGCSCEEVAITDIRVTVVAPGTAHHDGILAYDDTPDSECWTFYYPFSPSYNNGADPIYVLRCYNDGDCPSSQRCNKSGNWTMWACVDKKPNGASCSQGGECQSGYCDNDGVGLPDDGWCFTPTNTYFDSQEPTYCEYSTGTGSRDCDERLVGQPLNTCVGIVYFEDKCGDTCYLTDITDVFECNDTGCACTQPLCDGLASGAPIATCSSGLPYFADACSAIAAGRDRGDGICRSSTFAPGCTASPECNGEPAGLGNCTPDCQTCSQIPDCCTAQAQHVYDFSGCTAATCNAGNREAFRGEAATEPPVTNTVPATEFTDGYYASVGASDDLRVALGAPTPGSNAIARFVFTLTEPAASILSLTVAWEGHTATGGAARLYLWNNDTDSYGAPLAFGNGTTDDTLSFTESTDPTKFVDGSTVTVLVANAADNVLFRTDYVSLTVRQSTTPAACDDGNACTLDACNAFLCTNTDITTCTDGDGCCPAECNNSNDNDCPSVQGPAVLKWESRLDHSPNQPVSIALDIPDTGLFSEARSGIKKIVVTFDVPINPATAIPENVIRCGNDVNNSAVDLTGVTITTATTAGDTQMEIDFAPGLPNFARYRIALSTDIQGTGGGSIQAGAGGLSRILTALQGDAAAGGDRRVNATDLGLVRGLIGTNPIDPVTLNHVRADANNDGRINATDLGLVRGRVGQDARNILEPVCP